MLCQECPKKESCIELCNEAEAYVSQDAPVIHFPDEFHFTPLEKKILQFLLTLLNRREIRHEITKGLKISSHTLRTVIFNLNQKCQLIEREL